MAICSFSALRDHLISPFTTGYEGTGIESLYPSNTDMLEKARDKEQLPATFIRGRLADPLDGGLGVGKSFPVDLALGLVDAYEWSNPNRGQLRVWPHALNNDLRITPTGGEDSISNMHISKPLGSLRTYAYLGSDFTASVWLKTLRKGQHSLRAAPCWTSP